jgi:hypothetical protein
LICGTLAFQRVACVADVEAHLRIRSNTHMHICTRQGARHTHTHTRRSQYAALRGGQMRLSEGCTAAAHSATVHTVSWQAQRLACLMRHALCIPDVARQQSCHGRLSAATTRGHAARRKRPQGQPVSKVRLPAAHDAKDSCGSARRKLPPTAVVHSTRPHRTRTMQGHAGSQNSTTRSNNRDPSHTSNAADPSAGHIAALRLQATNLSQVAATRHRRP